MGILFFLIGLFKLLAPRAAWYLEIGWKLDDADPSDGYLYFSRVTGVFFLVISLFFIFT